MPRPERMGRYRLEEVIGVGSFATVHRAVDDWLEDTVAIKVLAENHSLNPEVRERFVAEGRSLRRISSPHVITVHDIGESERQQPFLVLELADRGTLADRVRTLRQQGWTATPTDVLVTAREVAAAVEAVHEAHLVHRDLSPGNLLLTTAPGAGLTRAGGDEPDALRAGAAVVRPDERLVVADLGMCKDLALNSGLTVAAGTSGFRPPEQMGEASIVDTRADLWALSAVLTWLCEGATHLPAGLAPALRRSQADDPADRHPDVASWLADIEAGLQPPAPPPPPPSSPDGSAAAAPAQTSPQAFSPASAPDAARTTRRWRLRLLGAAVLAALVFGTLGALVGNRMQSGPSAQSSSASVAIAGPDQLDVGQEGTFTATATGLDSWVWTLPSGQNIVDEPSVSITARTPGSAELVLRGRDADGAWVQVSHRITVGG